MLLTIDQVREILQAHVWPALAVTVLFGFILGLLLRGRMLNGRIRRAGVDRDVALTELDQVKGELDALFLAQRKHKEEAAARESQMAPSDSAVQERDDRIAALTAELDALRSDLAHHSAASTPAAEPVGETGDGNVDALSERNAWLETRVAALEADLGETEREQAGDGSLENDEELARLRWRNRYLEGRLAYFEEGQVYVAAADAETGEAFDDTAEQGETGSSSEPLPVEPEPESPPPTKPVLVATEMGEAEETPADLAPAEENTSLVEADLTESDEDVEASEPVAQLDLSPPDTDETHPSEVMLQQLENEQADLQAVAPPIIERPKGDIDDLTAISGIGPRIEEVLHELGIWCYQQIADWEPAHVAFVEQHLAFQGCIGREGWIEQAKSLIG